MFTKDIALLWKLWDECFISQNILELGLVGEWILQCKSLIACCSVWWSYIYLSAILPLFTVPPFLHRWAKDWKQRGKTHTSSQAPIFVPNYLGNQTRVGSGGSHESLRTSLGYCTFWPVPHTYLWFRCFVFFFSQHLLFFCSAPSTWQLSARWLRRTSKICLLGTNFWTVF